MDTLPIEASIAAPGSHLCGLAWDGDAIWHSDASTDRIYRLDPDRGTVLDEITCPSVRTDLAYVDGMLWQIAGEPKRIVEIDPTAGTPDTGTKTSGPTATGTTTTDRSLGDRASLACGLDGTSTSIWVGLKDVGRIEERSKTDDILASYDTVGSADGIAVVDGTIWYTSFEASVLGAIDRASGDELVRYRVAGSPTGMCFDGRSFWYSDYENDRICAVSIPGATTR